MSYVFISYSRQDRAYVEMLATALSKRGLSAWYDVGIEGGDSWWRKIAQKIEGCAAFVVVMTPEAEASSWVERELLLAERDAKPIIPLLLDGREFGMLINVQFYDVRDGGPPDEDAFDKLASFLPDDFKGDTAMIDPAIIAAALAEAKSGVIHDGLWYSELHVWVRLAGDFATFGITDFGQKQYGTIERTELPPRDSDLHIGGHFVTIETQKVTVELASPIDGQVVGVNTQLKKHPSLINSDPYEQGWMVQARMIDSHGLMSAVKYARYCKTL
jgi:glycine cleavage system H lipoate-binding protein